MNQRALLVLSALPLFLFVFCFVSVLGWWSWTPGGLAEERAAVEVFEIGGHNTDELPGGKEADGIRGDFVLRNEHLEAVIASALPTRKANMGTNWKAATPGCLYDLTLRGRDNDQLTCLAPANLEGRVSSVRIVPPPDGKGAAVEVVRSAALGGLREESHLYHLAPGARWITIRSRYSNGSDKEWEVKPAAVVKGLRDVREFGGISFGDAQNPRDRQGYAWSGGLAPAKLAPGVEKTFEVRVAVGISPAAAYGELVKARGEHGTLAARVRQGAAPIGSATLRIFLDEKTALDAYPDGRGTLQAHLPVGSYRYELRDLGRPTQRGEVPVRADERVEIDFDMPAASRIRFAVRDLTPGARGVMPCKAQIIGVDPTPDPNLGVDIQARGCRNQYHSERGDFTVPVAEGTYRVIVTRGIEYSHHEETVRVPAGGEAVVSAGLMRVVDTSGWISADFHNHSTPSGDNYCGTDDRVINLAAEHIEFAPTTEHNRFYDWQPHIDRLGLASEIATVVGLELTGDGAHFNAFPFSVVPFTQDNGAPLWQTDARINAIVLRDYQGGRPERYVQINHPQVGKFFRDRDADGVADGGFAGLADLIDAAEVWSTEILDPEPWIVTVDSAGKETARENRTFAWLQLLNQGTRMLCVAVSDAHSVFGNGVGGWRTYLPSRTDLPAEIDHREIVRHARAGRMFVTNGPFLEARLDDGTMPGGQTVASGSIGVHVRVQCTDWIDIDRVQLLVNGRAVESLDFRRETHANLFSDGVVKFDQRLEVPLSEDAHVIVVAWGERHDLKTGYGKSWQSGMHPCAFTNPIWIDADGHGFRANGDTLGYGLPVGKRVIPIFKRQK